MRYGATFRQPKGRFLEKGDRVNSEDILVKLDQVAKTLTGWTARCPAHDDKSPSLSISKGADGRTLLKCHAGCSADSICSALGITLKDLFSNNVTGHFKTSQSGSNQNRPL